MSNNTMTTTYRNFNTKTMVLVGMLSAIAIVLMYFDFPLPLFPGFLKIDLSDIPAIIGTFALGPVAGLAIELIKVLIYMVVKGTTSAGVGELANFVVAAAYIIPMGLVMRFTKHKRKVLVALGVGMLSMVFIAGATNYLFFIPAFAKVFGAPISSFVDATQAINPLVSDFKTMVLFAIVPFNILKATVMSFGGYYLYKMLNPMLRRMG